MTMLDTASFSEERFVVDSGTFGLMEGENVASGVDDEKNEDKVVRSSEGRSEEHFTATPENKITESSNIINSPITDSLSADERESKEKETCSGVHGYDNGTPKVKTVVFSSSWTESFTSPTDLLGFSPSDTGSHHGLGLQLSVERSVSTALFLGSVSLFLSSIATLYEQLGSNLIKIAQLVHPKQLPLETSTNDAFQSLYEDILSLGTSFLSSTDKYRTSIIVPLKKLLSTNGTERDNAIKQYRELRQACIEAKKSVLANYSRTTHATNAAETEIDSWFSGLQRQHTKEANAKREILEGIYDGMDKELPWEKSLKLIGKKENEEEATIQLIHKLKLVHSSRIKYSESVEKEGDCVAACREKEAFALEKAQKAEEDQMNFFVNNVLPYVFPEDEDAENLPFTQKSITTSESDRPFTEGIEKKGIELLSNLNLFKQQTIPYEEGMGVMDAETLGLPEELGIQRDKIKSSFSCREKRIEATEIVTKLFEEISDVTTKLSYRMRSQITNQRRKETSEGRSSSLSGSTIGSIWRSALSVFEDEGKLISETAFKITKLEKWLAVSRRNLETEMELDDTAWKRVCDAARAETRLESRYKQTKQQVEKVRQRASSKELLLSHRGPSDASPDNSQFLRKRNDSMGLLGIANRSGSGLQSTPNKVGRAFFKGGEAMKKLTENAIVQIAQISMNEVDQKEAKDQLALEEASTEKKLAQLAYASCTKERIDKIDSEDDSGWTEMKEIISKLAESIRALKETRSTTFQNRISRELDSSFPVLMIKMEEWSKDVQEKIRQSERTSSLTNCPENPMSVESIKSENVDALLEMSENDIALPNLKFDNKTLNLESLGQSIIASQENTPPSSPGALGDDTSSEDVEITQITSVAASNDAINASESEEELIPDCADTDEQTEREVSPEIEAFKKQFWSKKPEDQKMPTIIDIHTCAYRPKDRMTFLTPILEGRLYTTKEAIYFLAAEKNFTLQWENIINVDKEKGFMGSNNESDLIISYQSGDDVSSFLLCRLKERDKVVADLQRLKAENDQLQLSQASEDNCVASKSDGITESQLPGVPPEVPPDVLLEGMEIVVAKTIRNVSVQSVFQNVWADNTDSGSFYESWLREEECFDIGMGKWETAEAGDKFKNEWCNEKYDQQRMVTFKFNRTTHLYIGPPVAYVKQRHFIRVEHNDKCVLAISAEFEGIPYADTFAVEMRWVATRKGAKDVLVQVGLYVNFKKNTLMKSKIKSGTVAETKHVHLRLFDAVKKACTNAQDDQSDTGDDSDEMEARSSEVEPSLLVMFGNLLGSLNSSKIVSSIGVMALLFAGSYFTRAIFRESGSSDIQRLENEIQELRHEVRALHRSIDLLTGLLEDINSKDE